jgi:hypothetical protein
MQHEGQLKAAAPPLAVYAILALPVRSQRAGGGHGLPLSIGLSVTLAVVLLNHVGALRSPCVPWCPPGRITGIVELTSKGCVEGRTGPVGGRRELRFQSDARPGQDRPVSDSRWSSGAG